MIINTEPIQEPVEQVLAQKKKQEKKYLGSQRLRPGHTCFEYHVESNVLRRAKIERIEIMIGAKPAPKRVIVNHDCIYINCLN